MIKENQHVLNIINVLTDGLLVVLSVFAAYFIRFVILTGESGHIGFGFYVLLSVAMMPGFLFLYAMFGLYESFRAKNFTRELELLLQANVIGTAALLALQFLLRNVDISRLLLFFFFLLSTFSVAVKRLCLRRLLRHYRSLGYNQKHVLIVGSHKSAQQYYNTITKDLSLGLTPAGQIIRHGGKAIPSLRQLGDFDQLEAVLARKGIDEVVAALSMEENEYVAKVIVCCEKYGVKLSLIPFYADYMSAHPYIDEVGGLPLMNIRRIPLDNLANAAIKRTMDICGSLVLIVLMPLLSIPCS